MIKHILSVGLNDKDTKQQEIDSITAFKIVTNLIKKYYSGATIKQTAGIYTHESGEIVTEPSLEISILYGEQKKTLALVVDLKRALNQESILFEELNTTTKFI